MRVAIGAVVVLVAVATLSAQAGASAGALTLADIEAAIAFGEGHDVQPYRLRHAGRPDNPVVVGAVYTPFLRVALQARAAAGRGERLSAADLDPRATAPLVFIAFRWYCCDGLVNGDAGAIGSVEPQAVMLPVAPRAPEFVPITSSERRGAIRPVWSRRGAAVIEALGAGTPYDDIVLVAAFPIDALQPGRPFAIYKELDGSQAFRIGVVRVGDAATWR